MEYIVRSGQQLLRRQSFVFVFAPRVNSSVQTLLRCSYSPREQSHVSACARIGVENHKHRQIYPCLETRKYSTTPENGMWLTKINDKETENGHINISNSSPEKHGVLPPQKAERQPYPCLETRKYSTTPTDGMRLTKINDKETERKTRCTPSTERGTQKKDGELITRTVQIDAYSVTVK